MKITDLPTVLNKDCLLHERFYRFPIVLLQYLNGMFTWRGVGQRIPDHAMMIGVGYIIFVGEDDSKGFWPLEINPVAVEIDFSRCHWCLMEHTWKDLWCEDHDVEWSDDGHTRITGAKYKKKEKKE